MCTYLSSGFWDESKNLALLLKDNQIYLHFTINNHQDYAVKIRPIYCSIWHTERWKENKQTKEKTVNIASHAMYKLVMCRAAVWKSLEDHEGRK